MLICQDWAMVIYYIKCLEWGWGEVNISSAGSQWDIYCWWHLFPQSRCCFKTTWNKRLEL